MEKTLIQKSGIRIYSINFDFTSSEQRQILQDLQANGYQLIGYRGATGSNQITSGVPAWFAIDFTEMFGNAYIDCEREYKVYVYNKEVIPSNTTIHMQALSQEIPLGTALDFHQDGSFSTNREASQGAITVRNRRPAGTPSLTIGLAAKVNGIFVPFCAFTCLAQGQVSMKPNENIVLFAAQTNIKPGYVTGNVIKSGCKFMFSAANIDYDLQMIQKTYSIINVPGKPLVDSVSAGEPLVQLLNK